MPFRILTLIIMAVAICIIVGASSINSSGSGRSSPMEAGSILFLDTIILTALLIVWEHKLNNNYGTMSQILPAYIPSLLSDPSIQFCFESPNKFLLINIAQLVRVPLVLSPV